MVAIHNGKIINTEPNCLRSAEKGDIVRESELRIGAKYTVKGGNVLTLFREYSPNIECFQRQDGSLHYGREFIEFHDGERVLDLSEVACLHNV